MGEGYEAVMQGPMGARLPVGLMRSSLSGQPFSASSTRVIDQRYPLYYPHLLSPYDARSHEQEWIGRS